LKLYVASILKQQSAGIHDLDLYMIFIKAKKKKGNKHLSLPTFYDEVGAAHS